MTYLERFKARMGHVRQAYEGEAEMVAKRGKALQKMGLAPSVTPLASQIVDVIIASKIQNVDERDIINTAVAFAEMEWDLAAEVVAAARAERAA